MTKKNRIVIAALALIVIAAATTGAIALRNQLDKQEAPADNSKEEGLGQEEPANVEFKEDIDEQKNDAAKAIEEEAASLVESNPAAAKEKYQEAEKVYHDAGNVNKSSEMNANAMTAELLIQQEAQQ